MSQNVYRLLGSVYRFLIIGTILLYEVVSEGSFELNQMWVYIGLFLYAFGLSLLKNGRFKTYFDVMLILVLIQLFDLELLYLLFLNPISNFIGIRTKKIENILFSLLLGGVFFVQFDDLVMTSLLAFGLYAAIGLLQNNFREMDALGQKLSGQEREYRKLKGEMTDRTRELDIVLRMFDHSRRLNQTLDIAALKEQLVDASKDFFNASYVCLYTRKDDCFIKTHESGKNERHEVPKTISLSFVEEPQLSSEQLWFPIEYEGEGWGVIVVYDKRSTIGKSRQLVVFPFEETDLEILSVYIQQVISKIKHANLLKKMHVLANNDFLTGIANRRYFMKQFDYLVERSKRGESLSVLIFDVDHFKKFNDNYGHDKGDEVLKVVSKHIQQAVRKVDIVGRIGGEEFAALLPNTKGNAEAIADRIRKTVKELPFVEPITLSIGVAHYGLHGKTPEELLNRADKALYHAKNSGRDRVSVYEEGME